MATKAIAWGDGTADTISITYTGDVGSSAMTIGSAKNRTAKTRSRTVRLEATTGVLLATLTVTQKPGTRSFTVSYKNSYK